MKILLVEDDQNKRERIFAFVRKTIERADLATAFSYRSAVDKIVNSPWDLLLLDMTLPTYDISDNEDGFQTEAFAGISILREIRRHHINLPTIVITQFETIGEGPERRNLAEIEKILASEFPKLYLGTIFYAPGENSWMPKLSEFLLNYAKSASH